MSDNDRDAQGYDPECYELKVDGALDWGAALRDLEDLAPEPAAPKQAPPAPEPVTQPPVARRVSTPQPIRAPEPVPETMGARLADLLTEVNKAMNQLRRFEQTHPYLIAPNVFRVWEDGLRETSVGLAREYHRLRDDEEDG